MTFTEAAAEVLRLVGKPLHYKDITDIAVQKNLLSHVGKSPEVTMGARLAALLKKGPKENPLIRVRPGVFALRVWQETGGVAPVESAVDVAPIESEDGDFGADATDDLGDAAPAQLPPVVATTEVHHGPTHAHSAAKKSAPRDEAANPSSGKPEVGGRGEVAAAKIDESRTEAGGAPATLATGFNSSTLVPTGNEQTASEPSGSVLEAEKPLGDVGGLSVPTAAPTPGGATELKTPVPAQTSSQPVVVTTPVPPHADRPSKPVDRPSGQVERAVTPAPRPIAELNVPPPQTPDEVMRAGLAEKALEVFSEEDDDDKPLLGSDPEPAGRRRRRRRRRGEGGDVAPVGDGLPSYTVSPAFGDEPVADSMTGDLPLQTLSVNVADPDNFDADGTPTTPLAVGRRDENRRDERREDRERGEPKEQRETRDGRDVRETRDGREVRENRDSRDREGQRDRNERRDVERRDDRQPRAESEELAGKDLADTVAYVMQSFDRNSGPVGLRAVADAAIRRGKITGDAPFVQSQIHAAVRADNLRRSAIGLRPRFRISAGRLAMTDWSLGNELIRLEAEALAAVERYREAARRTLARKLSELPGAGFVELVLLVLERMGISQVRPVRRPGASSGETNLLGTQKTPSGEVRIAIVVRRDGREIGRERVADLRGSIHHYTGATSACLITAGQVLSGAREEAGALGAVPVMLLDGNALAKLCEEHQVLVTTTTLSLVAPDVDLFESFRNAGSQ